MTDADARRPSTSSSSKRRRADASSHDTHGSARAVGPWTTVRLARARSRRTTTGTTTTGESGNKRTRPSDGVARTTVAVEEDGGVDDDVSRDSTPRDAERATPDDGFRFAARRRDDEMYEQWRDEMKMMFRLFGVNASEESEGGRLSEKTARAVDAFRLPKLSSRDASSADTWKASMRGVVVAVTEAYEECERVRRAGMDPGCTTGDARELEESLIRCWLRLVKTPRGGASTSGRRSGEDMVLRLEFHARSAQNDLERGGTEKRDDEEKMRITAVLSAFSAAIAGFKYCASALYETVFTPLKSFSAACLTESNFDSSAHFVAWTIRTVEIASDLTSWKEGHYARMNVYGHADFVTWTRKLLDFFYLQLSSVRGGGIIDALGYYPGWKKREDNVHRRHEQSELYRLILKLPTMRWTLPWKKYEPQLFSKVDLRFSEKFQRKLTRFVLSILDCAIVNGIVFEKKESITRDDDVTDEVKALIDAIKCNKSSTVKELARSILIELGVAERLATWAGDAASEGKIETVRDKLSSLALILTVNPCKLGDLSELIEPLMKIFALCRARKCRSKDNYELESKLCAILACLGVNSNEREDDMPPDCELSSLRFGSGAFDVQIAVKDEYDDVCSVIFDMLDGVESSDTSKKSRADVLVPALAALAVFVRRNKELTRWFSRDGATEKIVLDILRRKEPAVSRIAAACVLAFEAHHELVQALYKPSVKTDKKRERITEVNGWNSKVICQSLTAIAELIKDPAASRYGYDAAVLEVICAERRTTILHNKFHLSLQRALACISGLKPDVIAGDEIHRVILDDYLHRLLASPETSIFEIKEGLTPEETTKMHCEAVWNELELDELHQDGPRALTEAEIGHFAEFIRETTEATKKLKEELKHDVEISDVCSILMEGDTDCRASQVGIVVPILTLLHKCRIFQEHNLVSEVDVAGVSDIERDACYVIGLLATKPSNQNRIANSFEIDSKNGIEQLIPLLKRYHPDDHGQMAEANASVVRRAADTITNLAHENSTIKTMVRDAGGIPPLVKLLDSHERKVQKAAASALRTLAFKNGENKNQIVECGALPKLIFMARSEDILLHKEAIGVIGNLVHSSSHIKRRVLDEGALQPVIELLKSSCTETQREAALLIGQFAARLEPQGRDVPDYKTKIMQRGAVESLIKMLSGTTYYREPGLREMAAFALGRLAQDSDNQVGICHSGGLQPLFNMLESDVEEIAEGLRKGISSGKSDGDIDADAKRLVENLQHNAAFAIYGLAESHDNVAKMLKENAFMRLQYSELMVETSKQCVNKTIKRLEEKVQRRDVFNYLAYTIASGRPIERQRIALALAWLCRNKGDMQTIFIEKRGLKILFDALIGKGAESVDYSATTSGLAGGRRKVNIALEALRNIKQNLSPSPNKEALMPQPSTPTAEDHMPVNFDHPELSDVTFVIHAKDGAHEFGAHRIAFTHVSDVFLSTLEDGKVLDDGSLRVDISDVDWNVFEAMMDFIYTGTVGVMSSLRVFAFLRDNLEDILTVTTRFDLPGMKSLVEKHFIDYVEMNELTFKRACELYRVAVEHNAVAVQDFLLCHALDNYDKRWHGDCEASPSLSAHKTRVRKTIDCFGQGFVSYIEKTLRDRVTPARDAAA